MTLARQTYRLSECFPPDERFGLTAQIRRAAASVPGNIAEGNARGSAREYAYFLSVSKGSLMETETYLLVAVRLGYLSRDEASPTLQRISEISKMLTALRSRLLK